MQDLKEIPENTTGLSQQEIDELASLLLKEYGFNN